MPSVTMTIDDAQLCPYCKKQEAFVERLEDNVLVRQVRCVCGTSGPAADDDSVAVERWNALPRIAVSFSGEAPALRLDPDFHQKVSAAFHSAGAIDRDWNTRYRQALLANGLKMIPEADALRDRRSEFHVRPPPPAPIKDAPDAWAATTALVLDDS